MNINITKLSDKMDTHYKLLSNNVKQKVKDKTKAQKLLEYITLLEIKDQAILKNFLYINKKFNPTNKHEKLNDHNIDVDISKLGV